MEIRSHKPFQKKKGVHAGKWRLRISYRLDEGDPWKQVDRHFKSYSAAIKARPTIESEIKKTHGGFTKGAAMTFAQLATHALATYYAPATIKKGVKVDGVKSTASINRHLNALKQYFGKKKISAITTGDLRAYRQWRNKLGSRRGKPSADAKEGKIKGDLGREISETTINRELQTMRRMMKDAHAEGWISRDVFAGAKVIKTAHEKERSRILTTHEERQLLDASAGTRQTVSKRTGTPVKVRVHNEYLRCLIILACDSGMRKTEMLKLAWDDIDLEAANVHVIATNTKTERDRDVPLSSRAAIELRMLPTFGQGGRVFPFVEFRRSWATAKEIAKIDDLHFHDLRSTAITRMIDAGIPLPEVAKIAGHEKHTTTVKHYVSMDKDMTRKVGDTINAANEARAKAWATLKVTSSILDENNERDILDADTLN
ncbi:MAG: site-specific integrase [Pyrinomonadaceae bacterium]